MRLLRAQTRGHRFALSLASTLAAAGLLACVTAASSTHGDRATAAAPPVAAGAPLTPKVQSLLAALTLAEKISLMHGDTDPSVPRGVKPRGALADAAGGAGAV
jgi:hypothetical protein